MALTLVILYLLIIVCLCLSITSSNVNGYSIINNNTIRYRRQVTATNGRGCELPEHPEFGKWAVLGATSNLSPGLSVVAHTVLQVGCNDNYRFQGDETIVCIDGKWSAPVGRCLKTCPPLYDTPIMQVRCTHNNIRMKDCKSPVDGTRAAFKCADYYEDLSLNNHPVHICFNGKWNHPLHECVPICGQKSVPTSTLIINGNNVTKGEYPWQVAIYDTTNQQLICSGSLISQSVILTAAHCLTNNEGQLNSKEIYVVAVGKYYRNYIDSRDNDAQFSEIQKMFVPPQYQGDIQNYNADIGIMVTKTIFTLSNTVQPVCVDWDLTRNVLDFTKKVNGYVTGWGYTTETELPSEALKELKVDIVSKEECRKSISEDHQKYFTYDKLCAGILDAGTAVCQGDSGGALVSNFNTRYYIVGIVSSSPRAPTAEGGCDSQQYALYTNVSHYIPKFLLEIEGLNQPKPSHPHSPTEEQEAGANCTLPEHAAFGRWSIFDEENALILPGKSVNLGTILKISCENGYSLDSDSFVICKRTGWSSEIGKCQQDDSYTNFTRLAQVPAQFRGQVPLQFRGQVPSQFRGQVPSQFGGQVRGQSPAQFYTRPINLKE